MPNEPVLSDAEVMARLAETRDRIIAAVGDDDVALQVLNRVWPSDWSDAPLAVVWLLGNASRALTVDPPESGLGAGFMQDWLDRLVWPDGEPRDDIVSGLGSLLGYVVVELVGGTQQPKTSSTLFAWDGGELFPTVEGAAAEAANAAQCDSVEGPPSDPPRFNYRPAEVRLALDPKEATDGS